MEKLEKSRTKSIVLRVWHDNRELVPDCDEDLGVLELAKNYSNVTDSWGYHDGLSFTDYTVPVEKTRLVLQTVKNYDDAYLLLGPDCRLSIRGKMCVAPASVERYKNLYNTACGTQIKNAVLTENRVIIRTLENGCMVNTYLSRAKFLEESARLAETVKQIEEDQEFAKGLGIK